jgi:ubiquinone/menaquinone biosynthesis C-methylase UbiE
MDITNHDEESAKNSRAIEHNAQAWNELARRGVALARPAADADFREPLKVVDPLGWLGPSITDRQVLCLAAGGGRQGPLYAAAGARVIVLDISSEMLSLDREVAEERGLNVQTVQGSMDDLSMFAENQFDIVIHPVSTCYVPDVAPVFREVARVTRPGGLYVSQHKSPVSLQGKPQAQGDGLRLGVPYYRSGPLPAADPGRVRESGTLEYLHRWEELVGGICRSGFVIEDLVEPVHADKESETGTFGHRSQFVAPYVRIKARRAEHIERDLLVCIN